MRNKKSIYKPMNVQHKSMIRLSRFHDLETDGNGKIKKIVSLVLGLLKTKIKIAKAKGEIGAMNLYIMLHELGRKVIHEGAAKIISWLSKAKDLISQKVKDSYEIQTKLLRAKAAVSSAAAKAVKEAATNKTDSFYRDCKTIYRNAVKVYKTMVRLADDRRRISTTMTPTMWEVRTVLGIKPGVSFNEKDWRAYKENGTVVVENKRSGQRYQRPINELVSIANQEKMAIENRKDPYVLGLQEQYGSEYMSKAERPKIEKVLRFIKMILGAVSGAVVIINGISAGTKGWGEKFRRLVARLTLTKKEFIDLETELLNAKAAANA